MERYYFVEIADMVCAWRAEDWTPAMDELAGTLAELEYADVSDTRDYDA